jgi:S-disulfanyl-L-cysteine oxidoreductase SoxD
LSANEVYGVSAYVLFLNGILDDDESLDANALRAVVMPNREGFRNVYSVKSSD